MNASIRDFVKNSRHLRASDPLLERLLKSPKIVQIERLLRGKRTKAVWANYHPVAVLIDAIRAGSQGPSYAQALTRTERGKIAKKIRQNCAELGRLVEPLLADRMPHQFQAMLDLLALEATIYYQESREEVGVENPLDDEDNFVMCRFAIYSLLMNNLPAMLETLAQAANWWGDEEQLLAKPNDPNANRLYFIRTLTSHFVRAFGLPLRALTLEVTSIYFDCSDIDEAAISRLAPVQKKVVA